MKKLFGGVILTAIIVISGWQTVAAQCVENPTGETAVGINNASGFFITFYIDGAKKGGVPAGDRSVDFIVTPGQHTLRAEALINGEVGSATRIVKIPAGYVCTWTVNGPVATGTARRTAPLELFDPLKRRIFITITIPN